MVQKPRVVRFLASQRQPTMMLVRRYEIDPQYKATTGRGVGLFSKGGGRRGLTRAPAAWAASAFGRPEHKIAHMGRCFHMFDHHGQYCESSQAHMSTCNAFLFPLPPPMSNERPTHHTDAAWMRARHSFSPGQGPRQSSVSLLCQHHRRLHPSFMVARSRPPLVLRQVLV